MELTLDDISFLKDQDVSSIHKRMLDTLPDDLDKTEGGFAHDFTYPTALEKARFAEQNMLNVISCIFPMFSFGQFLDMHANNRGISRKPATKASGHVQVSAKAGTFIPVGAVFSTIADDNTPYIEFVTTRSGTAQSDSEPLVLPVEAVEAGTEGNVSAHAIEMMVTQINNVSKVENDKKTDGGTDEETDDSLRERITQFDSAKSVSFVGSISDYKRWATSVPGVGAVIVIPAKDDSGVVTLIVTDSNGEPANEQLREDVYNYIMSPDDEDARIANVNALLNVIAPETLQLNISATIELVHADTLETVKADFISSLKLYLATCSGEIKYSRIGSVLSETEGINDYKDLTINGGISNIQIEIHQLPSVDDSSVFLTEGVVE